MCYSELPGEIIDETEENGCQAQRSWNDRHRGLKPVEDLDPIGVVGQPVLVGSFKERVAHEALVERGLLFLAGILRLLFDESDFQAHCE